jgi:hypothetical protein
MLRRVLCSAVVVVGLISLAEPAGAAPFVIGGNSYVETGPTETMTASFLAADGGISSGSYSEFVKLTVSGEGQSLGACLNDAFFVFSCGVGHDGSYYQVSFDTAALIPFNPAQTAQNFIYYDVDAGVEVSPTYVPAYRPSDHTYSFNINTGLLAPGALHFGVSDGHFGDNSGLYTIQITQLESVPEPVSLLLMAMGLGGLSLRRLRGARRTS